MKRKCFSSVCNACVYVFSSMVCALIFFLNVVYNSKVSYDIEERVSMPYNILPGVVMIAVFLLLTFVMCLFEKQKVYINSKVLFICLTVVYTLMAAYLITNVDHTLRGDAKSVYVSALEFLNGDYRALREDGYVYIYPHQLGLMLYDIILILFNKDPALNFTMNYLFVIGINYFNYKIAKIIFDNETVNQLTVIVSFAFLPQFFFILFAYGVIPGFFFTILAFYSTLAYLKKNKIHYCAGILIGISGAIILKKNFLIAGIAVIIVLFLMYLKNRKKYKYLFLILSVAVCMVLPVGTINALCEYKTGIDLNQGIPSILWIAMGTDIDNVERAPGWLDSSNYEIYYESGSDSEAAKDIGKEKLTENIKKMKDNPKKTVSFFIRKIISQWCEPMYQSVWSGPMEACEQYTHTELLKSIYNGGAAEHVIAAFSKFVTLIIWGLACVYLLCYHKKFDGWEVAFLFCVGGVLFHTMWEGKSQYTYPYVFCLIPFASYSWWSIMHKVNIIRSGVK